MNKQILNSDQEQLFPLIHTFSLNYYLVGGTATAFHLGHRRSIDFDLFTDSSFDPMVIRNKILRNRSIDHTFSQGESHFFSLPFFN